MDKLKPSKLIIYLVIFNYLMITTGIPVYASMNSLLSLDQKMSEIHKGVVINNEPIAPPLAVESDDESRKLLVETPTEKDELPYPLYDNANTFLSSSEQESNPQPANNSSEENNFREILTSLPSLGENNSAEENSASPFQADISSIPDVAKENADIAPLSGLKRLWQFMGADDRTQAGINTITGIATGVANNAVRDWLGQSSNSRFEFSSSGKGSSDVLLPLWDMSDNLLFSQIGIRRTDERTTYNLGSGWRHFVNDQWMLGINGFWDHDLTGNNSRVGVGMESWADYLKFSANGYFRITNWHQSPLSAMEDYDERPANGFDINTQAWLPFYPKLGGSLKFEKYFGKGIILSDSSSVSALKNSPSALTTGLNYTPFPLLTLSAGHKSGSVSEDYASLSLNYRTGLSWNEQLDSSSVGIMRSLAGSRYDFVDRNYNIVMQYRKQNLIALSLPASLTGEATSTLTIDASVTAKYGLKTMDWEATELLAAGGSLSQTSATSVVVTLPSYQADGNNSWRVTAIATDNHGNQSSQAETLINVIRSSNTVSLIVNTSGDIVANGTDEGKATAIITDKNGALLSDMAITFSLSGPGDHCIMNNAATCKVTLQSDSEGQATVQLSTTTAGSYTLLATMDNGNSDSKNINFVADSTTAKIQSLEVTTNNAPANGTATNALQVTVTDANENPVANHTVTLNASSDDLTLSANSITTNSDGTATFTATSTTAATFSIAAAANESTASAEVTFIADSSTAQVYTLIASATDLTADGQTQSVLTATIKDAQGNLVNGVVVTFTADNQAQLSSTTATTDSNGQASVTVTSRRAGTSVLTATINNSTGNTAVTFVADSSTALIGALTVTTDNATATSKTAATLTVTATTNGSTRSAAVTFVAGEVNASQSEFTISNSIAPADGNTSLTLTFTAKDEYGNAVTGADITFVSEDYTGITFSDISETEGIYTATIVSSVAGSGTVSVYVNGSSLTGSEALKVGFYITSFTISVN